MAVLVDLPPELLLHIISFLAEMSIVDKKKWLPRSGPRYRELIPDLTSINALSQANSYLHHILNQSLYDLCASVESLGQVSLLSAAKLELADSIEKIVAAGVSPDNEFMFENRYCSLLHVVSALGLRMTVLKLVEMYGRDVGSKVYAPMALFPHSSALDYAARRGHLEIVRILAPAPIPPPSDSQASSTYTRYLSLALIEAAKGCHRAVCDCLVSQGADANFLDDRYEHCFPLLYAVIKDDLQVVQLLLSAGADPNAARGAVLFKAIAHVHSGFRPDILETLLAAGLDLHVRDPLRQHNVLGICANVALVRFLLVRGVDPNARDSMGRTSLHHAYSLSPRNLSQQIVELLLQFGALPDIADYEGVTPMEMRRRQAM
ncbi:ankyrin repeat protein [Favolaschia claudopus]|uniref:Ankyrin repeat protein n=1 Tax=Favolaschia claudopus TaxID=2862362 RepID=A0AAW0EI57_9AGAR